MGEINDKWRNVINVLISQSAIQIQKRGEGGEGE